MITTVDALQSLRPRAEWSLIGDELEWLDSKQTQPTDAEIQAEVIRLQAVYDSQEYSRSRQAEYPSIEECIHAILDDDLTALQVKRQAVKDKYPKGDS
jgi:hypothetical protein